MVENATTEQKPKEELHPELKRWNWGAFILNWIWGLGNRTYLALICLIPGINIIMAFVLGAQGSRWAWNNRQWDSLEQFMQVQKLWSLFGLGVLAGALIGGLATFGLVAFIVMNVFF